MVVYDYFDGFQASVDFLIALGYIIGVLGLVIGIICIVAGVRDKGRMITVTVVSIILLVICGIEIVI